ncbi:MAG: hypothetical protein JSR90_13810 [Proteobacteria bacterium]|nr:hypothetical protein [Pseudomonadota bacterium]
MRSIAFAVALGAALSAWSGAALADSDCRAAPVLHHGIEHRYELRIVAMGSSSAGLLPMALLKELAAPQSWSGP